MNRIINDKNPADIDMTMLSCHSSESMREEEYHIGLADSAERVERKEVTNLRTNQNWCIFWGHSANGNTPALHAGIEGSIPSGSRAHISNKTFTMVVPV